jgi:PAS domain S-box-containing protein
MEPGQAPLPPPVQRARILVVDDDPALRRVVEMLLSARGWMVETAADGRAALAALAQKVPDLVIMDLVMPGIGGLGALRHLRADPRTGRLPVILMSVVAEDETRRQALEAGADDYLIKPFSEGELVARVTTRLDQAEKQRRRGEEERRKGQQELNAILDGAVDAVVGMNEAGCVDFWNPRAEQVFAWTAEEARGRAVADLIVPERFRHAHREGFARFLASGQERLNRRLEVTGRRRDGSEFPAEVTLIAFRRPDGSVRCTAFVADITERKAAEDERARLLAAAEEARGQAEAANRLKDEFLATLSHELRTPLNAIVGWVHLLRTGRLDENTTARALETIDRNAKIQTQLITDILDVSRIVSGKLRVRMRALELAPIVEAARDTVRLAAEAKGLRLAVALDPQAGPVMGDPDRLQQIVWNLLANAIKFTPDGGRVDVEVHREGAQVVMRVSDNGVGILPDFLPYVFERFRQADASTTRPQGGLGLGLAIVRHLSEVHGGSVRAESGGPGLGATFTLRLPLLDPVPAAAEPPEKSEWPDAAAFVGSSLEGVSVVLVSADPAARAATGRLLRDRGAEVLDAASAEEALDMVRRLRPDVLLSHVGESAEESNRLIRAVRELPPERGGLTPAAAFGGEANAGERMKSLLAGYQTHLAQPVAHDELAMVAASLVGRTRGAL